MAKGYSLVQLTGRKKEISHQPGTEPKTYALLQSSVAEPLILVATIRPSPLYDVFLSFLSPVSCATEHPLAMSRHC